MTSKVQAALENISNECCKSFGAMVHTSHLLGNISGFSLEVFEGLHYGVIVQDGALDGTNSVQKTLLQLTELST